jgi:histidine triad (HIT) family protein
MVEKMAYYSDENCLFCKIVKGDIPSTKVYETETVYAFRDIEPQAPQHIIIIPKEHISSTNEINGDNSALIADVFEAAAVIARLEGFADNGYRVVNNCGMDGGQTVGHIHFHLLAGRYLQWPPG